MSEVHAAQPQSVQPPSLIISLAMPVGLAIGAMPFAVLSREMAIRVTVGGIVGLIAGALVYRASQRRAAASLGSAALVVASLAGAAGGLLFALPTALIFYLIVRRRPIVAAPAAVASALPKSVANWDRQRRLGRGRYIAQVGVVGWGLSMFIAMNFIVNRTVASSAASLLGNLAFCLIGGALFGLATWHANERNYQTKMAELRGATPE
jgi:hypothetical protein